ncbi:MAG: type I DNA topoisomerase [Oscillospiraceae bacterium]|nr:type I DNA topoisomerase [Oscillospiraceae bacterium]
MAPKSSLVIVESPSKAKTIGKYLGDGYQVKACMGHLRDLPKSTIGVDIENDFEPEYIPIRGKEAVIRDLKKSADSSPVVYLATDPDREGEAISWHLKYLLNIPDEKAQRVTFNEITRKVVTESIQNPREIDQDLVDAQQARRLLDRIVGYKISPVMWKKIRRGLSAGRVQSVATRMVDDRDREIGQFQPQEYWTLDTLLQNAEGEAFKASYHGIGGKKTELKSEDDVLAVQKAVENVPFTVASVKRTGKQRSPAPPFTTSTLQQDASYKLNMTPRRTMSIAQQLYEGIELTGEGAVGLITYMRTDSLRISAEAQRDAASFIAKQYGSNYCPEKPRQFKSKGNAQDAHEAIRPSNVFLTPDKIRGDLTPDQYRLYSLIWHRFLASQMENAVYDNLAVVIEAGEHGFRASASKLKFPGYLAAYDDNREDAAPEAKKTLPELREGENVALKGFEPAQHFTQPPAHYTEATLIRAMEEQGIGRPSTYAPTISTILDRRYVKKEGKYLYITNLGESVTRWMKRYFENIEDTGFTAHMEQQLDDVEEGKVAWKNVLRGFYEGFEQQIENALGGEREHIEPVVSDEVCPVCGKNLVERDGKFGTFLGCPGFPECTFTMPLVEVMPGRCPKCGGRLLKRSGISKNNKQYIYYCCEFNNPRAENRCDLSTWDVPTAQDCPECGHTMFKKSGKGRMTPFCINESCKNFLPEEKRGYRKKTESGEETPAKPKTKTASKTASSKKPATKKPAAKKAAAAKSAGKKPAARKTKEKAE